MFAAILACIAGTSKDPSSHAITTASKASVSSCGGKRLSFYIRGALCSDIS